MGGIPHPMIAGLNQLAIACFSGVDERAGTQLEDQIRWNNAAPPYAQKQQLFVEPPYLDIIVAFIDEIDLPGMGFSRKGKELGSGLPLAFTQFSP